MSSFRPSTPNQITSKTIGTLYAEMLRPGSARLNLKPIYQRARCWKKWQNDGLVGSIMCGRVIPLFAFYKLHSGNEDDTTDYEAGIRFECVDGQNRLSAIAAFMSGDPIVNSKGASEPVVWNTPAGPKHFRDLSEEEKEWFTNMDLPISIIQAPLTLTQRKEQFTCLQDGSPISQPEYMRNTSHPVSLFISRTGLRDTFDAVVRGPMTGIGDWLVVLADCITLYLHRGDGDRFAMLNRDSSRLKRVISCKEPAVADSPYDMQVTKPDDAPLMELFDSLITVLGRVKDKKVKYHKFCVVVLFNQLLVGGEVPPVERLLTWFKSSKAIITDHTKAGGRDVALYGILEADLAAELPPPPAPKPKRRAIPKKKRDELWAEYFGVATTGVCQCCKGSIKGPAGGNWHQAHIVAVAAGGKNDLSNLVPTCASCNLSCGDENLSDWCEREWPEAPFLTA